MGPRCCVEAARRVARNCWKTFDKAKDLGDHFASNPSNTGWTSTGGGKNILKTPRAILWRDWTGNFRQDLQNYQDSEDIGAAPFAWQMGKAKMPS